MSKEPSENIGKSLTDWKRVDRLTDEDIEQAAASDPDAPLTDEAFWADAAWVWHKADDAVPVEREVLDWFRRRDHAGYTAHINRILKEYVEKHQ